MDSFADCPLYMGLPCFEKSQTYSRAANSLWTPGQCPGTCKSILTTIRSPYFMSTICIAKCTKGSIFSLERCGRFCTA